MLANGSGFLGGLRLPRGLGINSVYNSVSSIRYSEAYLSKIRPYQLFSWGRGKSSHCERKEIQNQSLKSNAETLAAGAAGSRVGIAEFKSTGYQSTRVVKLSSFQIQSALAVDYYVSIAKPNQDIAFSSI